MNSDTTFHDAQLQVRNLTKSFGGVRAVDNVSFDISRGETVGLIGPNGAGKTTVFNLITGFSRADSGTVIFEGKNIVRKSTASVVNHGVSRTFQIVHPFLNISVLEAVKIGSLSPRTRKIEHRSSEGVTIELLARVGLEKKASNTVSELTHGELKRLDVARSLSTSPAILLLDEPYGGLGSDEIGPMNDLIKDLASSKITILLIEHRMKELMRNVQRVLVMDQGALIAQGTPAEIVRETRVIEAYLGKGVERNVRSS